MAGQPSLSTGGWEITSPGITVGYTGGIPGTIEPKPTWQVMERPFLQRLNIRSVMALKKPTKMVKLSFHKHPRKIVTLGVHSFSPVVVIGGLIMSPALPWEKCWLCAEPCPKKSVRYTRDTSLTNGGFLVCSQVFMNTNRKLQIISTEKRGNQAPHLQNCIGQTKATNETMPPQTAAQHGTQILKMA